MIQGALFPHSPYGATPIMILHPKLP